jgi:hypothetical protein
MDRQRRPSQLACELSVAERRKRISEREKCDRALVHVQGLEMEHPRRIGQSAARLLPEFAYAYAYAYAYAGQHKRSWG